jgi:hypothetical protein
MFVDYFLGTVWLFTGTANFVMANTEYSAVGGFLPTASQT